MAVLISWLSDRSIPRCMTVKIVKSREKFFDRFYRLEASRSRVRAAPSRA